MYTKSKTLHAYFSHNIEKNLLKLLGLEKSCLGVAINNNWKHIEFPKVFAEHSIKSTQFTHLLYFNGKEFVFISRKIQFSIVDSSCSFGFVTSNTKSINFFSLTLHCRVVLLLVCLLSHCSASLCGLAFFSTHKKKIKLKTSTHKPMPTHTRTNASAPMWNAAFARSMPLRWNEMNTLALNLK